jgi:integrase/recombinase XerD
MLGEVEHFRYHGEERHSWQDAVKGWAENASDHLGTSTIQRYLVSLGQCRTILDDMHVDEITKKTMGQIAGRAGITNATRRRDLTAVSSVIEWTVAKGWRDDNPARERSRSSIKERRDPIALPEPEHIAMVVANAPGNFAKMILTAQFTGMREEEIASLERPQTNLKRRAIDLTKTKTRRPRSVPLDDRAVGTIAGTVPHIKSRYVFWHGKGERYANVSSRFAAIVRRVAAKAIKDGKDFRRFKFHDLRHWYAVDYLRRGGSIYDCQQILGHESIKTTEVYLRYLTPAEQQIAKRIGSDAMPGTFVGTEAAVSQAD